jgi:hypothetical protein
VQNVTGKTAELIDRSGLRLKKYLYSFTVCMIMNTLLRDWGIEEFRDWGIKGLNDKIVSN